MRLYHLEKIYGVREFDSTTSLIVAARTPREAREIAHRNDTTPGSLAWINTEQSTCKPLRIGTKPRIVHTQTLDG